MDGLADILSVVGYGFLQILSVATISETGTTQAPSGTKPMGRIGRATYK